uniref:Putative secreted protein n=1 Tax=Anopheles darlingi TaxID=43151 RepID=A0A2M4DFA1_ANODA
MVRHHRCRPPRPSRACVCWWTVGCSAYPAPDRPDNCPPPPRNCLLCVSAFQAPGSPPQISVHTGDGSDCVGKGFRILFRGGLFGDLSRCGFPSFLHFFDELLQREQRRELQMMLICSNHLYLYHKIHEICSKKIKISTFCANSKSKQRYSASQDIYGVEFSFFLKIFLFF